MYVYILVSRMSDTQSIEPTSFCAGVILFFYSCLFLVCGVNGCSVTHWTSTIFQHLEFIILFMEEQITAMALNNWYRWYHVSVVFGLNEWYLPIHYEYILSVQRF